MPLFITYASYSNSGVKGLIDKPSDRSEITKTLLEKAGGKLIALYIRRVHTTSCLFPRCQMARMK